MTACSRGVAAVFACLLALAAPARAADMTPLEAEVIAKADAGQEQLRALTQAGIRAALLAKFFADLRTRFGAAHRPALKPDEGVSR